MKTRSTERGFALVILVIIMIIVGIIGVGLVSVMGAKQKSYPFQAQAYKALMLANAGVEYAIRYANENPGSGGVTYFSTARNYSFGGGSFNVQYYYPAASGYPAYSLRSKGTVGNVQREVVLNKFPGFVKGEKGLILTSDAGGPAPSSQSHDATIPITNLYDANIYVKYMRIRATPHSNIDRLERMTLNGNLVYNASVVPTSPIGENLASPAGNPNYETQGSSKGICMSGPQPATDCPDSPNAVSPAWIPWMGGNPTWNIVVPPGDSFLVDSFSSGSIQGTYEVTLYYDFDTSYTNLKSASFTFTNN
jgi:hypothetical protein